MEGAGEEAEQRKRQGRGRGREGGNRNKEGGKGTGKEGRDSGCDKGGESWQSKDLALCLHCTHFFC